MDVIRFAVEFRKRGVKIRADARKSGLQACQGILIKDFTAILWNEDQVDVKLKNDVPTTSNIVLHCLRPIVKILEWSRFFAIGSNP
ncbi:conserved hypothetical protein [Candidatus Competibacter denitrificans Run_A_D11]|uniref:Uncharacterized protein n=1 Tax=Candidatus Competibacter denitrificans Run_A_D11 TaxID=1400863 RepID=W6M9U5_9GAMM|nr:conserved hypothetical protein [Candidatus Competibacter denitrificans Run_A_D11]